MIAHQPEPAIRMAWTPDTDNLLRSCRDNGMTFGQIYAHGFFPGKTRNAILARAWRIGLASKKQPRSIGAMVPKRERSVVPAAPRSLRPKMPKADKPKGVLEQIAALPVMELPPDSSAFAINFFEAERNDDKCRFPLGDTHNLIEFRFCGDTVFGEGSYCARHYLLTHRHSTPPGGEHERASGSDPSEKTRAA